MTPERVIRKLYAVLENAKRTQNDANELIMMVRDEIPWEEFNTAMQNGMTDAVAAAVEDARKASLRAPVLPP